MEVMLKFLFSSLLLCLFDNYYCEDKVYCHQVKEEDIWPYCTTKTPYRVVKNPDDSLIEIPGCQPQRIWMMIRHGTRYPGRKLITKMTTALKQLQEFIVGNNTAELEFGPEYLCLKDVGRLKGWFPQVGESSEKYLTHEGEDEMIELAERFQNRFPQLFPDNFDNTTYKFRYTATQRTGSSAQYFAVGLFGRIVSRYVWFPEPIAADPVLRFYKLCKRWRVKVAKNPATMSERRNFEKSPEMISVLKKISTRLRLKRTITMADGELMYATCAMESAWDKKNLSPWCSVFSEEDLKVFEYAEDLRYYWIDGYGHEINYKQACVALKDMMAHLKATDDTAPQTVISFSHSGTMLKLLSHLGLYKDGNKLLHDNYESMALKRKWRVGKIDSFGSNLAFVLFKCDNEEKLLTLHQERPVVLPGCPPDLLCPLPVFLKVYNESLEECNFTELCTILGDHSV